MRRHRGDTVGYRAAITALRNLARLPDANDTPSQITQSHRDVNLLNRFFKTHNLYS